MTAGEGDITVCEIAIVEAGESTLDETRVPAQRITDTELRLRRKALLECEMQALIQEPRTTREHVDWAGGAHVLRIECSGLGSRAQGDDRVAHERHDSSVR